MTDTQQIPPRPSFDAELFTTLRGGHAAEKFAASAVAPLVVAARGYETVFPDEVREAAARHRLGSMNSAAGRKLKENVGADDAMIMPWYRLDETAAAAHKGVVAKPTSLQMRPASPILVKGKLRKYDMFAGSQTELDLHPATPKDWLDTAPVIFFTEGLIKGDAALTAMLRANGVSDEELSKVHADGNPALAMRQLMEQIPVKDRFLIVSFVGVGNWRQRHEWAVLPLKGRQAWIAFDADASANAMVWAQAKQLTEYLESRKMTSVHLLNLGLVSETAAAQKVGVDDYLATLGRWEDLPRALTDLPERPGGKDDGKPGEWRVSPDGLSVQRAEIADQDTGAVRWATHINIGGRVVSRETLRAPSRREMETGRTDPRDDSEAVRVEIEVMWSDPLDGVTHTARVTGPSIILAYPPKDWDRKGARIPDSLLSHPEWPPEKGMEWLRAVKSHRREESTQVTRWKSMGWVPSDDGVPSYICGDVVVTADGASENSSIVGVTSDVLSGAPNFGVIPTDPDVDWKAQALEDLEAVLETYLDSGAWTSPSMAATILAIALRPAVPILPRTVAYFVGPRRSGKTYSATHVMSFWQPRPGVWGGETLPGSAKDTIASMEHSVAHANIWVSDDLAPSISRGQAEREESSIGDLMRSIHNGVGKRRMFADGTPRPVLNPRAALVVTAENEPSVSSVGDRIILLQFGDGALGPTEATSRLDDMLDYDGEPARLAQAFIRWFIHRAQDTTGGWEGLVKEAERLKEECESYARNILTSGNSSDGDASRHAKIAADAMLSLIYLSMMAADLGADPQTVRRLRMAGLPRLVVEQVSSAYAAQKHTSPGRRVIDAVRLLLSAGHAHVASLEDPNNPPAKDSNEADLTNRRLGWVKQGNEMRPVGPNIGWLITARDRETEVVLIDPEVAFTEAQRRYPMLIPHGQKQTAAWSSAWAEELTVPEEIGWKRRSNGRSKVHTVRVTSGGQGVQGVPVLLSTLLDQRDDAAEEDPGAGEGLRVVA